MRHMNGYIALFSCLQVNGEMLKSEICFVKCRHFLFFLYILL